MYVLIGETFSHLEIENNNTFAKGKIKMAQLQQAFDANNYDPTQGGSYLKKGRHRVQITASDIKENSAGTGGFLELSLESVDPETQGQIKNYILNLYNASLKSVEIAHKQLSALCHVIGVFKIENSAQLHGKPFMIELVDQELTPEQEAKKAAGETVTPFTEVKKVFDVNGNEPGKAGQPAPSQQPAAQQQQVPAQQPAANAQPAGQAQPAAWGASANANPAPAANAPAAEQPAQQPAAGAWQQNQAQAPAANNGQAPWSQ